MHIGQARQPLAVMPPTAVKDGAVAMTGPERLPEVKEVEVLPLLALPMCSTAPRVWLGRS